MKSLVKALCMLMLLSLPLVAVAENSTKTGGYTIHHNALTTNTLPVQVATAYRIQRSKSRALLNVSVIKDEPGTTGKAVRANIKAIAKPYMVRFVRSRCAKSSKTPRSITSRTSR